MSIICYDSNGNALKRLYQWDINQTISISGLEASNAPAFHFCNKISSKALVVTPSATDDKIEVSVPNILLQQPYPIIAYLYEPVDEDGGRTMHTIQIPVFPRPKPEDYVYTETEVLNYKNLDSRVKALEQGGASAGDIAKAVEEYMTENPIEIPETLPNPHKLTLTGAVQAEYDGSEAVTVEVPEGGGGSSKSWVEIGTVTLAEDVSIWDVDIDSINRELYGFDYLAVDLHFAAATGNTEEKPIEFKPRVNKVNNGERLYINYAIRKSGTYDTSIYIESRGGKGIFTHANSGVQMSCVGSNGKKITGFNFYNSGSGQLIGAGTTATFWGRDD